MWQVSIGDNVVKCATQDEVLAACERLHAEHGGVPAVQDLRETLPAPALDVLPVSDFGPGNQVIDQGGADRVKALHSTLIAAGVNVDATQQLFETGTRLAAIGYATQSARKVEHDAMQYASAAADALMSEIRAEERFDLTMSADDFARHVAVNDGKVTMQGLTLSENALRGLANRLDSPMFTYTNGLITRCARGDADMLAEVLRHECRRLPGERFKVRARGKYSDVYAVLSESYTPCDAPSVLADIVRELPGGTRGTYTYDPDSTSWELKAQIWTPTPTDEHVVGEPFKGYSTFTSRDNGTSRFRGGGGVELLRCLNASTYYAHDKRSSRIHRGAATSDVGEIVRASLTAMKALIEAWGRNREHELEVPKTAKVMRIEDAIPGFYRALLTDRRELVQVLPGKTEERVAGLTQAWAGERRDPNRLTRADLAQGWTRYIQGETPAVRAAAESAIGEWLVSGRAVPYVGAPS